MVSITSGLCLRIIRLKSRRKRRAVFNHPVRVVQKLNGIDAGKPERC